MTKVSTIDEQFIYRSDDFGRAFWVDKYNDLQSAPLFVDNSIDLIMLIMYQSGMITVR